MEKQLTFKHKFGYMLGDLANNLTFGMSAGFLMAFYTDSLGITAAAVGTLFLVARMWDAINDPLMGVLTDKLFKIRQKKHKGKKVDKFRPFLLRGAFPVVIAGILMFYSPDGLSQVQKLVWAYATYIFWGMSYTFVNIPYGSLQAVMTQDPAERSSLSVARGLGGMVGNLLPRLVVPLILARYAQNEARGFLIAASILGGFGFISYLVAYFTVEEKVTAQVTSAKKPLKILDGLKLLSKNRAFIAVSVGSIAMLIGMMTNQAMSIYYFRENLQSLRLLSLTGLTSIVPMLIVSIFLSKVVAKFGVKKTVYTCALVSSIFYGTILVLPDNPYIYIGILLMASLFMTIPNILVWGMVSDSIDYNQYLSGQRQEGAIYGSYSFVRKAGQALAGFLSGQGLAIVAYNPDLAQQTVETLFGIKFLTVGLPALGMFVAFLSFKFIWHLTPEKKEEITRVINSDEKEAKAVNN
ncbi:MAG: glycoside-pentoside-hexuronide (GPH):cation symporter [Bacillota bacterium]